MNEPTSKRDLGSEGAIARAADVVLRGEGGRLEVIEGWPCSRR